jgi:hypothetical protein
VSRFLLALVWVAGLSAADPYQAWSQGRPAESAPDLAAAATTAHGWTDAGLAYAAAGDQGQAVAALLRAHRQDPTLAEPRQALRALGAALPPTVTERVGPLGWPGRGWCAVGLLALAGLALGLAMSAPRGRRWWAVGGVLVAVITAPGVAGRVLDARQAWTTVLTAHPAVDATGALVTDLAPGTLLRRINDQVWAGRLAVRLPDGRAVFVAAVALAP